MSVKQDSLNQEELTSDEESLYQEEDDDCMEDDQCSIYSSDTYSSVDSNESMRFTSALKGWVDFPAGRYVSSCGCTFSPASSIVSSEACSDIHYDFGNDKSALMIGIQGSHSRRSSVSSQRPANHSRRGSLVSATGALLPGSLATQLAALSLPSNGSRRGSLNTSTLSPPAFNPSRRGSLNYPTATSRRGSAVQGHFYGLQNKTNSFANSIHTCTNHEAPSRMNRVRSLGNVSNTDAASTARRFSTASTAYSQLEAFNAKKAGHGKIFGLNKLVSIWRDSLSAKHSDTKKSNESELATDNTQLPIEIVQ